MNAAVIEGYRRTWDDVDKYIHRNYGVTIDDKPKNPASLCFVSWDADLWMKDAEEFSVDVNVLDPAPTPSKKEKKKRIPLNSEGCNSAPLGPAPLDAAHCATAHCVQFNARVIEEQLKFQSAHPILARIERSMVAGLLPLVPGERNSVLTREIAPRLFGAMSFGAAQTILNYYIAAGLLGGYPADEAHEKFKAAWEGLEESFVSSLNDQEKEAYRAMGIGEGTQLYRDGFRILGHLAAFNDPKYPRSRFFISSREFAARLHISSAKARIASNAYDMLKLFVRWGIIRQDSRGGARGSGGELAGKAAEFTWLL